MSGANVQRGRGRTASVYPCYGCGTELSGRHAKELTTEQVLTSIEALLGTSDVTLAAMNTWSVIHECITKQYFTSDDLSNVKRLQCYDFKIEVITVMIESNTKYINDHNIDFAETDTYIELNNWNSSHLQTLQEPLAALQRDSAVVSQRICLLLKRDSSMMSKLGIDREVLIFLMASVNGHYNSVVFLRS